ncbi:hypothetical protein LVB77_14815 [Lysobacter sp. 5GHs7-4]|uniref:hypothetical protein n=1 Tax=Lysobacter sp. 5GHs7-4 TaxID=2904253 RepID=UPI001E64D4E9|nr:hypothetical protein [Lysobacter sp. 5GHs7-4]UHQ21938.1 hypothetical protein LVB77_14815 [Lysobacter sp. 5GHs7-4]
MPEFDQTLAVITALVAGDRWLSADAAAAHLGMFNPKGEINRRGFLERVACRPSFPVPLVIGNEKKWKKSEVDQWAEDERKINRAA